MLIAQMNYQSLLNSIQNDRVQKRFNTKVVLLNNLNSYFAFIEYLEGKVDVVIGLSDPDICLGDDTIPSLSRVLSIVSGNPDKDILITSMGEYLRVAQKHEAANKGLFSIISHAAFSKKRVWIPIFAAKEQFIEAVGNIDEEHYPDVLYEVEDSPSGFVSTVYSKLFSNTPGIVDADGLRSWIKLWDEKKIHSGMSFSTRFINQFKETDGTYTLNAVSNPFKYFLSKVTDKSPLLIESLGNDSQWLYLTSKAPKSGAKLQKIIENALNMLTFDENKILGSWNVSDANVKWTFWLWYKLSLNELSDYISFAVNNSESPDDIVKNIEMDILSCINNPNFDIWIKQRHDAMEELGLAQNSKAFWQAFDELADSRSKLKLLSGRTIDEQAKIIELVAKALKAGQSLTDYKTILEEKYPDLVKYIRTSTYLPDDLKKYISGYKRLKIADNFDIGFSDSAETIDIYDFDTRSTILKTIKNTRNAYYLWVDGMGIEWIDLLIEKISEADSDLNNADVKIGTAVLPTITEKNMACADPDTVSEKINDLDSLSHIKDKTIGCNYFLIIARQIELISKIAQNVSLIANSHPGIDIVITSDHGMSRLAAKGFHSMDGIKAPSGSNVCGLGRYCAFDSDASMPTILHTAKDNGVIAFKNHCHFSASGYAPGEIHGGASPEEILVPIIHYKRKAVFTKNDSDCSYNVDPEATLLSNGMCNVTIKTHGSVNKVIVEFHSKRIAASKIDSDKWSVSIPNLSVNHNYVIHVYLNNIYSEKEESFYVKSAGMQIDDDLF